VFVVIDAGTCKKKMVMKVFVSFLTTLALLLIPAMVQAQSRSVSGKLDEDYRRYLKIMEEETAGADSDLLDLYYRIPEQLPAWFFNPGRYTRHDSYFIGISEPGMDSLRALELAELRARALAVLSQKARIEHISDHYQRIREDEEHVDQGSRFLDYSRIAARQTHQKGSWIVEKTCYTRYGEGIVLVSLENEGGEDTLSVSAEFMQLTREDEVFMEQTLLCRLNVLETSRSTDSTVKNESRYLRQALGDDFRIRSVFNTDTLVFPYHPYRYVAPGDLNRTDGKTDITFSLKNGLWNGFVHLLFSNLTFQNRKTGSRVKSSYDQYSLKNQGIIRSVSGNYLHFDLTGLSLKDNHLSMDLLVESL
jgi:hypothetical protein